MSHPAADIFRRAAELNEQDHRRRGNTFWLEDDHEVIVAGDVHGQRKLLARIIAHAALSANAGRILVLQELIHGDLDPASGKDRSVDLLLRSARLKLAHPEQVLFVMSNHTLAQVTGGEISKDGRGVCKQFAADTVSAFAEGGDDVLAATLTFLRSMPLAVRCRNGVFIAHSIPSPQRMDLAGVDILDRVSCDEDLHRGGGVYEWTWGRNQTPEQIDALAETLGVSFFLLSHRLVDGSYELLCDRAAAITSDSLRGCIVSFRTNTPFTADDLPTAARLLGALGSGA